ncbi:MAG: NAD(P)/FAD-dependent oxidoreductase [Acidobacteriota bacterium]|nr:NAD(P)/FAD-dependent oxidoreductase [Acidobacteriota bacterium]
MDAGRHVDVAIVGAGPAGSRAAWRLARAGARIAWFDGSFPREKPCGGGVTGRALDLVRDAIDPAGLDAVAIDEVAFARRDQIVTVPLGSRLSTPPLLTVTSRRAFDEALVDAAVAAGVPLIPSRVRHISAHARGWELEAGGATWTAHWLLGADGANSFVRRLVHTPFAREDLSIATGFFVHGCTGSSISIAFEDEPAGYLWSFPRPDHMAVGVCAQADRSTSAMLLAIASRWIEAHLPAGARLERYSWPIPSLGVAALAREPPAGSGWMLLGDAGGMVDPITREGIYFALASGDAAADSLVAGDRAAHAYARRIRDGVHSELRRAAVFKERFFDPRFTDLLMHALGASAPIREVMIDLIGGIQPYRGLRRRLLRTWELRLALRVLRRLF